MAVKFSESGSFYPRSIFLKKLTNVTLYFILLKKFEKKPLYLIMRFRVAWFWAKLFRMFLYATKEDILEKLPIILLRT